MLKVVTLALSLLAAACSAQNDAASPNAAREQLAARYQDRPIPNMPLIDAQGAEKLMVPDDYDPAKPLVVNLWATWCTPCIKEMPSLLDLHQSGEAVVVAVSTDRMTERVGTFLTQHGLNDLPVRIDPGARALRAADLTPPALPITFIVRRQPDGTFVIKGAELGEREWAHPTMRRKIRQVFDR